MSVHTWRRSQNSAIKQEWQREREVQTLGPFPAPQNWLLMAWGVDAGHHVLAIYTNGHHVGVGDFPNFSTILEAHLMEYTKPLNSSRLLKSQWAVVFIETRAHTLLLKIPNWWRTTVTQVQRWTIPAFRWENKLLRAWLKGPPVNHCPCWLPTSWLVTSNHIHVATEKNPKSCATTLTTHSLDGPNLDFFTLWSLCLATQRQNNCVCMCRHVRSLDSNVKSHKILCCFRHGRNSPHGWTSGTHSWCWRQKHVLFFFPPPSTCQLWNSVQKSSPWKSPFKSSAVNDLMQCACGRMAEMHWSYIFRHTCVYVS